MDAASREEINASGKGGKKPAEGKLKENEMTLNKVTSEGKRERR